GQSLLIVLHCRIELPQPAIRVAKIVLDIRIAGVAKGRIRESLDRSFPIAGADRSLACCEIGIERCPIRRFHHCRHGRADRPPFCSFSASAAYYCIKDALASLISTRSVSASLVISASFRKYVVAFSG